MILAMVHYHPAPGTSVLPILWMLILAPGLFFKALNLIALYRRRRAARGQRVLGRVVAQDILATLIVLGLLLVSLLIGVMLIWLDIIGGINLTFASVGAYIGFVGFFFALNLALSGYAVGMWFLHRAQLEEQRREADRDR